MSEVVYPYVGATEADGFFRMDDPHCWERLLEQVPGLELDYGIAVYHYRPPT